MFVIVTGSNGTIGQSIVKKFSSNKYQIIGIDRHKKSKIKIDHYFSFDLEYFSKNTKKSNSLMAELRSLIPKNKLHVLVNNAAIQKNSSLKKVTLDEWEKTFAVNVTAPLFLSKKIIDKIHKKGSIINIGSIHSKLTKTGFLSYSVSKASLNALTRSMALELGNKIRVNAVEPAAVNTKMLKKGFGKNYNLKLSSLKNCHPVQDIGDPAEIAELVYSISSENMPFLNGSIISIDGGISSRLFDPS